VAVVSRDTYHVRAVYGSPPRRDDAAFTREIEAALALGRAVDAKAEAAMLHTALRVEVVLAALVVHCGNLTSALARCRVETHGYERAVILDGASIWRGRWRFPTLNESPLPDSATIVWEEEWWADAPPDVRAAAELPMETL
jgi:hypothetical protein